MKPLTKSTTRLLQVRPRIDPPTLQCRRTLHHQSLSIIRSLCIQQRHNQPPKPHQTISHLNHIIARYASSTAANTYSKSTNSKPSPPKPDSKPQPPTKHAPLSRPPTYFNEKLNPPTDTYAPKLEVAARQPGQNYFSYLLAAGKTYIAFYKEGLKRVRRTSKLSKSLRARAGPAGKQRPLHEVLTRAEWQVVKRSKKDLMRLGPFAVLVLLMGEYLPLVALWITPLVPEACRIPVQVKKELEKGEKRRSERERRLSMDRRKLVGKEGGSYVLEMMDSGKVIDLKEVELERCGHYELLRLSAKVNGHSFLWDWTFVLPPKNLLRWRLKKTLEYLKTDDELIARDGGWAGLAKQEVQRACAERGVPVLGKSEGEMRRELPKWLKFT